MAKMFVQLRGVVYLLVLVQCCVFFVHAQEEQTDPSGGEFGIAERKLQMWAAQSADLLADGRSCLSVWEKELNECNETYGRAKSVLEEAGDLDGKIEEIEKKTDTLNSTSPANGEELDLLQKLLGEAKETVRKTHDAVDKTVSAIRKTRTARQFCEVTLGNVDDVLKQLHSAQTYYSHTLEEYKRTFETEDRIQLNKNSSKTYKELDMVRANLTWLVVRTRFVVGDADAKVDAVKKTMNGAKMKLGRIDVAIANLLQKRQESPDKNKIEVIKSEVEVVRDAARTDTMNTIVSIMREEDPRDEDRKVIKDITEKLKKERGANLLSIQQARKAEEERLAEEKRQAEKQKKEQEDRAKEEAKRIEEEKKRKAEEEKARQAAEKVAEEEAKRVVAEKAKEAAESAREEQARQAAEKAKKKKDGAVSPALMHIPLILLVLLLCVLGSTLVC
ncbi:uncharacterized protein TM35_000041260 [Trypanosoma theileri]|uniref:Uncharacterized protein n=1 Tax=Trypanosoma theileri TaxID=67003 RepID=A0A1X0P4Q7_9TRYP|nr:uncharacterized protein TM35_000041260 [Trypanosoma theileri]ORC91912.1 hypothetical protein TM35_000041260 [Trypanosoma theileri]